MNILVGFRRNLSSLIPAPSDELESLNRLVKVVYSTKGIVSSSQPLATEAGLEILRKGGNAADAAVATSAALNVTEPSCCGIGGDAFCLFYDATTKKIGALNGSGRAPANLTIEYLRARGVQDNIPATDINSVTVPGAAAAWLDTVEKFGSGKVTVEDIFAPAVRLAEEGVPVSEIHSHAWQRSEELLRNASPNGDEMLLDGRAPLPGEVIKLPTLARTFRELVQHGKAGFYEGRVAEEIVRLVQSLGGVMELEDLASHTSTVVEPIKYTYAGEVTLYECPPNGQGLTALMALGILESMQEQGLIRPLSEMEHNSAEYCHSLIEALRLAFADTRFYVADPAVEHVPVEELLSKEYLHSRAQVFDPKKRNPGIIHGDPVHSSDTVYFTVADQWGNSCSFIQSNYAGFGTGAIPKGCGFTLQNRGSNFSLEEGHPNALKGGKRPYHTIIPALATRGDDLLLSYGVMGGFMQPQGHVQVLLNILRGYTPQTSLDAPRLCISPAPSKSGRRQSTQKEDAKSQVHFEDGFSDETIERLKEMGHDVGRVTGFQRGLMGRGQIIQKVKNKSGALVWAAGSDPRCDGHAAPQI